MFSKIKFPIYSQTRMDVLSNSLEDVFSLCDKDSDQKLSFTELISFCDVIQSTVPPAILARRLVGSEYNTKLSYYELVNRLAQKCDLDLDKHLPQSQESETTNSEISLFAGPQDTSTPKNSPSLRPSRVHQQTLSLRRQTFAAKYPPAPPAVGSTSCLSNQQSPRLLRIGGDNSLKKTISMLSLQSKRSKHSKLAERGTRSTKGSQFLSQLMAPDNPDGASVSSTRQSRVSGLDSIGAKLDRDEFPSTDHVTTPAGDSFVEQLVLEACQSHFNPPLDFQKSILHSDQQITILTHVICQLSSDNTVHDQYAIQEVVSQVHQLILSDTAESRTSLLTPENLSRRLTFVAEMHQSENNEGGTSQRESPSSSAERGDRDSTRRKRFRSNGSTLPRSNISSTYSSRTVLNDGAPFIPISNEISYMNVLTNSSLELAHVDPKYLQEAQVDRDRERVEKCLARCLQRMSDEGIEVHPSAAVALYLFQISLDFSKDELSDMECALSTHQQAMRDYAEQQEHNQLDFDLQLERLHLHHEQQLQSMRLGHEKLLDQTREQSEREKLQMAGEHKHELIKLRIQLERLDAKNTSLKDKLADYQKESKHHTLTINKLEKQTKNLIYERTCLEEQFKSRQFDHDESNRASKLHDLIRIDSGHDNSGVLLSSPESTLKWDTISEESMDVSCRNLTRLDEETESARNCKGFHCVFIHGRRTE
ncbi:uncharacterized protein LOC134842628 [Symsagittifera roscoffensis]|uniref:uncharacterized protein LOC134842628 n=1 Tax=Symsagittifera roscoffensis TaxID=84072 RepID=UPI00307B4A6F